MQKLYDVVFGQNEFEKTKIDVRFEIIKSLLHTLSITSLEDFEYLESCLYKIKDQLRVKSSNLNKVIRDTQKSLTKKKVLLVVDHLLHLRNTFLNDAFSALVKENPNKFNESSSFEKSMYLQNFDSTVEEKAESIISSVTSEAKSINEKKIEEELFTINPILFENDLYSIVFITTTSPYLRINFKESVDFSLLRDLSSLLFDSYNAQGTTITIENLTALIIPRMIDDSLIDTLPQNSSIDVNESQQKLLYFLQDKAQGVQNAEYVELDDSNKIRPQTKKEKEESLDSLLSSIEDKKQDPTPKPKPKEDSSKISFEKDSPIEIERTPPKFMNDEITIIKKDPVNDPVLDTKKKEEKPLSNSSLPGNVKLPNNLIYEDDQLFVYLSSTSKAFGEILIEHKSGKLYGDLSEQELSYISIFTKIFSSILFETLQSHGTNIFWSTNESVLHIVPRMQDDALNFQWKPKEDSDAFLEQIKGKLFQIMSGNNTRDKITGDVNNGGSGEHSAPRETVSGSPTLENDDLKKKAQSVLDALRRIP
jgi:hypothetical protein